MTDRDKTSPGDVPNTAQQVPLAIAVTPVRQANGSTARRHFLGTGSSPAPATPCPSRRGTVPDGAREQQNPINHHAPRSKCHQSELIDGHIQTTKILIERMDTKPELERVDLSAVVADELGTISQTYENAVIRRNLESNVHVRADHLVSAVIEKLVTNGIVHNDRETPTVDVTLESKNGEAILTIADDGPGLPEVDEDQLIDPGEHGDQGLGLYLAETLVTEYGGALSFDDNDPRGTVVRVALPLA